MPHAQGWEWIPELVLMDVDGIGVHFNDLAL